MKSRAPTTTACDNRGFPRPSVFCLALLALLSTSACMARAEEPLASLIHRAGLAQDHQAELYAQVIGREVDLAKRDYAAGKLQQASADIAAVGAYGDKLLAAAKAHRKHLKQAEIKLREASRRLQEMEQELDLDQLPPVKQAVSKLEQLRSDLLQLMFAPPGKH